MFDEGAKVRLWKRTTQRKYSFYLPSKTRYSGLAYQIRPALPLQERDSFIHDHNRLPVRHLLDLHNLSTFLPFSISSGVRSLYIKSSRCRYTTTALSYEDSVIISNLVVV